MVAVLQGNRLTVANAGDSRAVLARGTEAFALSDDHKPASQIEKDRITSAGGFISEVRQWWGTCSIEHVLKGGSRNVGFEPIWYRVY